MSTLTTTQIITSAYRKTGNLSPTTAQKTAALEDFQSLLGILSIGTMIPYLTTEDDLTLEIGKLEYTIGSGGDFDTPRPIKIISGYLKDSDGLDYTLRVIMKLDEYNAIPDKTITTRPERLHYLPAFPLATIYFDAESDAAYTFTMQSWKPLLEVAIDTEVIMPEEYRLFFIYNLAVLLAHDKNVDLSASVFRVANDTMKAVKRNNSKIETAEVDRALTSGGIWNGNYNDVLSGSHFYGRG